MPMGLDLCVSAAKGRCNDSRWRAGKRSTPCCGVECVNMQMGIGREEQDGWLTFGSVVAWLHSAWQSMARGRCQWARRSIWRQRCERRLRPPFSSFPGPPRCSTPAGLFTESGPPPRRQHKLLSRPRRDEVKSSQVHRPLTPFPLRPFQPTTPSSARKPASARRAGLWVSYSQSLRLSLH